MLKINEAKFQIKIEHPNPRIKQEEQNECKEKGKT